MFFSTLRFPLFDVIEAPIPLANNAELSVEHQSFRIEQNEAGQEQVLIEGTIQNKASTPKTIPTLIVRIFDKDNTLLTQKKVHTTIKQLESGQIIPFYTSLIPVPLGIDHIDVQF